MRSILLDDSHAAYVQADAGGLAVVILHGWAASLRQWDWLLPVLAHAGYTAYAVDLLGHGRAPRLSPNHRMEDYAEYISSWMKHHDIDRPVLLGHSMGGYLGLQFALDNPQAVRGLILVDPLYDFQQFDSLHKLSRRVLSRPEMLGVGSFIFRYIPTWLIEASQRWNPYDLNGASATMRRQIALDHKRADPYIVQSLAAIGDLSPRLSQVMVPCLVTWGSRDHLLCPDSFETLVDLLPAAQSHCFAGAGHHPHLTRTQAFIQLVLDFLRQVQDSNWEAAVTGTVRQELCTNTTQADH